MHYSLTPPFKQVIVRLRTHLSNQFSFRLQPSLRGGQRTANWIPSSVHGIHQQGRGTLTGLHIAALLLTISCHVDIQTSHIYLIGSISFCILCQEGALIIKDPVYSVIRSVQKDEERAISKAPIPLARISVIELNLFMRVIYASTHGLTQFAC
jgi:hypothetical protein